MSTQKEPSEAAKRLAKELSENFSTSAIQLLFMAEIQIDAALKRERNRVREECGAIVFDMIPQIDTADKCNKAEAAVLSRAYEAIMTKEAE